jgi:hypothetical protein
MKEPICKRPWTHFILHVNGSCYNCCRQKSFFTVTEGSNVTFEDAWNCDNLRYIRSKLLNGEIPSEFCKCIEIIGRIENHDTVEPDTKINSV